jgi:hypothetical protein
LATTRSIATSLGPVETQRTPRSQRKHNVWLWIRCGRYGRFGGDWWAEPRDVDLYPEAASFDDAHTALLLLPSGVCRIRLRSGRSPGRLFRGVAIGRRFGAAGARCRGIRGSRPFGTGWSERLGRAHRAGRGIEVLRLTLSRSEGRAHRAGCGIQRLSALRNRGGACCWRDSRRGLGDT